MENPQKTAIIRYAETVIRFRWVVIAMTLLSVIAAGYGAQFLNFSNNYRVFFSAENPELRAFEDFQTTYTKNDNILFVIKPKDETVFTPSTMAAVEKLTEAAWYIPYALRVDSVTNFQYSYADGDELIVDDLIYDVTSQNAEYITERGEIALKEPLLKGMLVAGDAGATGINVVLQYPEKSINEVPEAAQKAQEIADEIRKDYPDLTIALTGVSMLNNAFAEAGKSDSKTLMPIMFLILIVMMVLTLRSFSATFATVLIIGCSLTVAMGLAGHFGILLTPISVTAPTIILTLAIADSVHILVSMFHNLRAGMNKDDAIIDALRINFMPVTITSLTTVIGFMTLNFSDAPPFHDLGNITAMGITAAWLYSLSFLPAVISLLPLNVARYNENAKPSLLSRWLNSYGQFVVKRSRIILPIVTLISVGLICAIPRIELNDQWVKYFDERLEFRTDADFGTKHLTGVYQIEFSVPAESAGGISEPEYLEHLDQFAEWLRQQDGVRHVYSISDIMRRLNKNMHADDPAWYKLPDTRDLAAQYLLLYEMSLPYGLDLNDRINIDKSATRITATLNDIPTGQVRQFIQDTESWFADNAPPYMQTEPTGPTVMFSYISQRNIESMLKGNTFALIAISLILVLALRSLPLGVISLIPNAVPILVTFGLWALIYEQIGMAAAGVSAVALGIVVDDTVHFMSKYLRARREKNLNKEDATIYAFQTVGTALIVTTIILTLGFMVMATSTFLVNEQLGLMTAATMIIALIIDFTLLPCLLLLGKKSTSES
ncbi:MAG: MMPL family transporter [Pseudomonadota bacterium]|nr:MMPL family transporter [Pseudomonadota bacterium]